MKLTGKIIIFNVLIPWLLVGVIIVSFQLRDTKNARIRAQEELAFNLDYVIAKINDQLTEKEQYLQDQARLYSTVNLYSSVIDSYNENDWLALPDYTRWRQEFAGGQEQEDDVVLTYVGFKGLKPVVARPWADVPRGYDTNTRPWYTKTVEANDFSITDPYMSANAANLRMGVSLGFPIYKRGVKEGSSSDIIGVAGLDLDMIDIRNMLKELEEKYQIVVGLYNREGEILYDGDYESLIEAGVFERDPNNMLTFVDFVLAADPDTPREEIEGLFEAMSTEHGTFLTSFEGEEIVVAHSPMAGGQWVVNISQPFALNGGEFIKADLKDNFILTGLLLVVLVIGALFIMLTIVRNIKSSSAALEDISQGDADLTVSMAVHGKDEIGLLAQSFNRFIERMKGWIAQIKDVIDDTDSINMQVSASTEETTAAVEEANAILTSISQEVENLDRDISSTVAAVEQITANVNSMDNQITGQSTMVQQSTAAITQMLASLGNVSNITKVKQQATADLTKVTDEGKKQINITSETFKLVVQNIEAIQEMAEVINGIASQTNLLSMNAAIEAAHAGDAGRGFAVVADEIRKLAETAAQSSSNISRMIESVTKSVKETDQSVERTSQVFDEINSEVIDTVNAFNEIEQSLSELNTGSREVLQASEEINTVTNNIQTGSQEIKAGTQSILDLTESVRSVSLKVNSGMKEVTNGNGEILTSMQLMVDLSKKLDEIVRKLKEQFGGFKTE